MILQEERWMVLLKIGITRWKPYKENLEAFRTKKLYDICTYTFSQNCFVQSKEDTLYKLWAFDHSLDTSHDSSTQIRIFCIQQI